MLHVLASFLWGSVNLSGNPTLAAKHPPARCGKIEVAIKVDKAGCLQTLHLWVSPKSRKVFSYPEPNIYHIDLQEFVKLITQRVWKNEVVSCCVGTAPHSRWKTSSGQGQHLRKHRPAMRLPHRAIR